MPHPARFCSSCPSRGREHTPPRNRALKNYDDESAPPATKDSPRALAPKAACNNRSPLAPDGERCRPVPTASLQQLQLTSWPQASAWPSLSPSTSASAWSSNGTRPSGTSSRRPSSLITCSCWLRCWGLSPCTRPPLPAQLFSTHLTSPDRSCTGRRGAPAAQAKKSAGT